MLILCTAGVAWLLIPYCESKLAFMVLHRVSYRSFVNTLVAMTFSSKYTYASFMFWIPKEKASLLLQMLWLFFEKYAIFHFTQSNF